MLHTWHPRAVGAALITSALAVAVASPVTHVRAPLDWPDPSLSYLSDRFRLGPGATGPGGWHGFQSDHGAGPASAALTSWLIIPGIAGAGLLVGLGSVWWPELPGNGKSILHRRSRQWNDAGLRCGDPGPQARPHRDLPARRGGGRHAHPGARHRRRARFTHCAFRSTPWTFTPSASLPSRSTCAAGVLAVTQRAPIWAALFVWELARPPLWVLLPFLAAALAAHGLNRWPSGAPK